MASRVPDLSAVANCAGLTLVLWSGVCHAQHDDAERIPEAALDVAAKPDTVPASHLSGTSFLETNFEKIVPNDGQFEPVNGAQAKVGTARMLFDTRIRWQAESSLAVAYSGRLEFLHSDADAQYRRVRNELREVYVERRSERGDFVLAGRINMRNGVAVAFNPTDFFKTRTVVDTTTRDPAVLREDRLGTFMLAAQWGFDKATTSVAIAPKLVSLAGLGPDNGVLNANLKNTNGGARAMVKSSIETGADINPELIVYHETGKSPQIGLNLTHSIGKQLTVYAEYAASSRNGLTDAALDFGINSGDLPASAAQFRQGQSRNVNSDLALGGTWSNEYELTITGEFDYHQAGWSGSEWQRWLALTNSTTTPGAQRVAAYLRNYAAAMQEPLSQRALFLRVQRDNFILRGHTFSAFLNVIPGDHSFLTQITSDYKLSDTQRLRATWIANRGRAYSQYGADPTRQSLLLAYSLFW